MSETTVTTTEQTTVVETVEQTVVIQVITPEGTELVETEQGTTVVEVYVQGPQGPQGEGADVLTQSISDGDTTHAPSGDAVFDALAAQTAATAAVAADLATHEADTANPHAVTAAQVGADATGTAAAAVAAHVAAGDPHPGYLLESAVDTDGTLAANSDALIPTQKAVKSYADGLIAANDVMQLKGVIDCSANPNYPAADAGHTYRVSVAGKIGGASGPNVEAGDILLCLADSTASGNHATVGTSWTVVQVNIIGALTSADIGSTVQAYDATLAALAAANWAANALPIGTGADTLSQTSFAANTFPARASTGNLVAKTISDDALAFVAAANNAAMRTALGVPGLADANTWTAQNTFAAGTITTSQPLTITQTWNAGGVTFTAIDLSVTNTASAAASLLQNWRLGGTSMMKVDKAGILTSAGGWVYAPGGTTSLTLDGASNAPTLTANSGISAEMNLRAYAYWFEDFSGPTKYAGFGTVYGYNALHLASTTRIAWSSSTAARNSTDTNILRAGANAITFGGANAGGGAATTRTEINKLVSAIADATATAVFTVTVPNAAHSANVEVTLNGSLGAGGAIGANEATGSIKYNVSIARTAGVNAVATISTAYGSTTSSVAGAATITVTGDLSAISGAVGATNTFTIRVTITKGSGSSANHTCTAHAVLLNANATGITIA